MSARGWWVALLAICALAVALRLGLALALPTIQRPDELFQNLEPAYRLWTGAGTITWEWRAGLRSPIFPGLLAGIMAAAGALGAGPAARLAAIAAAMSLLSTLVVAAAFRAGQRQAGLPGALCCGLICAVWPDLVYFGAKPLAEIQGGNLLAVAALLLLAERRPGLGGTRIALAIGAALGLAVCLRYQLLPAILLAGGWAWWRADRRERGWLLVAGGVPLLGLGIVDWVVWGAPFHSVLANFQANALQHVSREYGTSPAVWYAGELLVRWGAAVVPIAVAAAAGLPAAPLLGWIVALVVLPHSLVAHKEISFVQAAVAPTLVLAGLGTARLLRAMRAGPRVPGVAVVLAAWAATALATGLGAGFMPLWTSDRPDLLAMAAARADAGLCGLGLRWPVRWFWSGSDALLGRPIPIYAFGDPGSVTRVAPAINAAIGGDDVAAGLPGFGVVQCWPEPGARPHDHQFAAGRVCLATAPGRRCVPDPAIGLNAVAALGRPGQDAAAR